MDIENLTWLDTFVTRELREKLLMQKAKLLWFTGLSGSGKSTVANSLELKLNEIGKATYLLDGDNIRLGINSDLGFSNEDRNENIRRISEISKLFIEAGIITIACFISPLKTNRQMVRDLLGKDFIEIFVDCSLEECEKRDPKDLYKKARLGQIKEFTGISSPYEKPVKPEIVVNTKELTLDQCVDKILDYLKECI